MRVPELVVPTERGLDHMAKSDEIMAAMDARHAEAFGAERYADFKRLYAELTDRQRAWRTRG